MALDPSRYSPAEVEARAMTPLSKAEGQRKVSISKRRTQAQRDKKESDRLFSLIVRARGACETCGSTQNLQCSHIYSRRYINIRCDELNAMAQCAKCHLWWHDRPLDAVSWLHDHYPVEHLVELARRSQATGVKIDWHAKRSELKTRAIELGAI